MLGSSVDFRMPTVSDSPEDVVQAIEKQKEGEGQ